MIKDKKILAVIPARGGSKGVPLKNIKPVHGVPLIAMAAPVIKQTAVIDRAVVSTDHDEIARIAEEAGLSVPFRRPPTLSGDRIGDWDVLHHALLETEKIDGTQYDVVLMLQPTSPMRTAQHLNDVLQKIVNENLDAVWTVSETDLKAHPLKQLVIKEGKLDFYDPKGKAIIARQQLTPVYFRNGIAYAFSRACLLEQKSIMGKNSGAVVIKGPLVNIDTIEDFERLERLLQKSDSETPKDFIKSN